jgi:anaphase-promoting complex subunit 1
LFNWLDRVQAGDEQETGAGGQLSAQNETSGLWLRKDFVEEARWQIWGVQSDDTGGGVTGSV